MKRIYAIMLLVVVFALSGCATYTRRAPTYEQSFKTFKTIAVLPVDVKMYELSAGGQQEEIDEWSEQAKELIEKHLKIYIEEGRRFKMKFVDEDWLKANHGDLFREQRALYEAVSLSAMKHAYTSAERNEHFPPKMETFDYTLGEDVHPLAEKLGADALLFVYGYDHEATAGRITLAIWNVVPAAFTGVYYYPKNPSLLTMGIVNGKTGDLEWFKITNPASEYSFRKEKHIDVVIKWLVRDFYKEEDPS